MVKHAGGAILPLYIDRSLNKPISVQICMGLRDLILTKRLKPGARMPSTRTLAVDLDVSRTTVVGAFEQLISEGILESRTGAGTFVSEAFAENYPEKIPPRKQRRRAPGAPPRLASVLSNAELHFSRRRPYPYKPKAFVSGLPAFDQFPLALWNRLSSKHWRASRNEVLSYDSPQGYTPLRQAIADYLGQFRGVSCSYEQIFVVSGAQQAFGLISGMLLNPGEEVWFENPGAIGARNSILSSGARLIPVPIDQDGIMVEEGLHRAPNFRLAFVTPSHQQPLGITMGLRRRLELLRAADAAKAWIIEDDYDGDFQYSSQPPPTLKSLDRSDRVFYVGTFSKSLFPSLRLGYIIVPRPLVEIFDHIFTAMLQGSPTSTQAVVAEFIREGHFASHLRRMRSIYQERQTVFYEAAKAKLAGLLDVYPMDTGFHSIGHLPDDADEYAVEQAAFDAGVAVAPIGHYCLEPLETKGLVLGFSSLTPSEIKAGMDDLASALCGPAGFRGTAAGNS